MTLLNKCKILMSKPGQNVSLSVFGAIVLALLAVSWFTGQRVGAASNANSASLNLTPTLNLTQTVTPTVTPTPTFPSIYSIMATLSAGLAERENSRATATLTPTMTLTPTSTPSSVIFIEQTATAAAIESLFSSPLIQPGDDVTPTPLPSPILISTPLPSPVPIEPSPTPSPTATALQPTPVAEGVIARVPILMYHYLSTPPQDADIYRRDLSVTPENFEAQLAYLKEAGFTAVSLDDLSLHLAGQKLLPEKSIILTFDDGYVDNYRNAYPLLQKYGFSATFFLATWFIDSGDPNYVTWDNVREMHAGGMDFGAHSYRHFDMRGRDVDFLVYEIVGSKEAIEERTQETVRHFVYPAGHYDQQVIDVLQSAHFWTALTTSYGFDHRYDERFTLPRIRMRGEDSLDIFKAKVNIW